MITKREIFKKIYCAECASDVLDSDWDNMIMVSTKNWNSYFLKMNNPKMSDADEIKNVQFLEFNTEKEMFKYWKKREKQSVINLIDWSLEFEKPCILESIA